MAERNRCSSTLPESSTWVVQEPPLRFCASWAASSRDSTPPAIKRSTIDLLTAALIRYFSLGQMQCPTHRVGERATHPHRVIFLQACDGVADIVRKDAVNRAAIVSEPAQVPLQCRNVSRLYHQLFVRLEIIDPTGVIARGKISGTHRGHLVKPPMSIARRQRIGGGGGKDFLAYDKVDLQLAIDSNIEAHVCWYAWCQ